MNHPMKCPTCGRNVPSWRMSVQTGRTIEIHPGVQVSAAATGNWLAMPVEKIDALRAFLEAMDRLAEATRAQPDDDEVLYVATEQEGE